MRYYFLFSLLFLFFIQPVFSQRIILTNERTTWNVALTEFRVSGSGRDISYIANVLPSFFMSQFAGIPTHTLSSEEILLIRKRIVSDQIDAEQRRLSSLIREYDSAYFGDITRRREITNRIRDSRRRIRQLEGYNLRRIQVSPVKDIVFTTSDEANNPLSFDPVNIDNFARANNFDYIFYGSARQFGNIIILEVRLYSALEKKDLFSATVSSEAGALFSSLDNVISEVTSILLGTTWSRITVNTDNRESDIFLSGKYIGTGSALNVLVSPGAHTLTIRGRGQEEKTLSVFLDEKKASVIDLSVTLIEEKLTAINTLPQGASVYLDSLWVGVTPFILNGLSGDIIIRKDGFRDARLFLDDIPQNSIEIQLSPDIFRREEFIAKRRNSFYTSLSLFVLSVPVTFFLYAIAAEHSNAYNAAIISHNRNWDEINRLGRTRNYAFYGYSVSLFLTVTFFINTIFRLNDYIRAADVFYNRR
ncbi:MAG: hypothetical protein FWC36_06960 [Spirochaetes bacterium]|nr:hypothetical protein [Spirochaetota bacterium]